MAVCDSAQSYFMVYTYQLYLKQDNALKISVNGHPRERVLFLLHVIVIVLTDIVCTVHRIYSQSNLKL